MQVRCIFCGNAFAADDSTLQGAENLVTCPKCSGTFSVGSGGAQPEVITPLLQEEPAAAAKSAFAPGGRNFYIALGVGAVALIGVVFFIVSVVNRTKAPSQVSRQAAQEKKVLLKAIADEHFSKGAALYKQKNYAGSIPEFQKSLTNNPQNVAAFVYLGGAYVRVKNYKEAIPYLEKGKAYPLYQKFVFSDLGVAQEGLGRYREAVAAYSSLAKVDPRSVFAYKRMGFCHTQLKDYKNAEKALNEALKIDPKDQWARTQLAFVRTQLKKK